MGEQERAQDQIVQGQTFQKETLREQRQLREQIMQEQMRVREQTSQEETQTRAKIMQSHVQMREQIMQAQVRAQITDEEMQTRDQVVREAMQERETQKSKWQEHVQTREQASIGDQGCVRWQALLTLKKKGAVDTARKYSEGHVESRYRAKGVGSPHCLVR